MRLAQVVGICGKLGSGKTTAALNLSETFGYRRERFAGPLKDMLRALGLSEAEVDGGRKEVPCDLLGGRTPRWAMQSLGTEWARKLIHPDLWINAWGRKVDAELERGGKVVCDDVRFANEAEAIRSRGGIIIKITSFDRGGVSDHVSEMIPFQADREVSNNLTKDSLFRSITRAVWIGEGAEAA